MARLIINMVLGLLLVAYPFLIYLGIKNFSLTWIAGGLLALFGLRIFVLNKKFSLVKNNNKVYFQRVALYSSLIGSGLAIISLLLKTNSSLLFYPVVVNILFLIIFTYSLYNPPTIIESLARLKEPDLPIQAINYTRKVTQVWVVFFIFNASISLFTALSNNLSLWTLYNGLISYLLIGMIFLIELGIRQYVKRKFSKTN